MLRAVAIMPRSSFERTGRIVNAVAKSTDTADVLLYCLLLYTNIYNACYDHVHLFRLSSSSSPPSLGPLWPLLQASIVCTLLILMVAVFVCVRVCTCVRMYELTQR